MIVTISISKQGDTMKTTYKNFKYACLLVPALFIYSAISSADIGAGLWDKDYQTMPTPCGFGFGPDMNGFCQINDGPVELGVTFSVTKPVLITGARIYRVDNGDVSGSLWSSNGNLLAHKDFDPAMGVGWQDLAFDSSISAVPGEIYTASYHVNSMYAYEYEFFTNNPYSKGPITALQAIAPNKNGVFCYSGSTCFPTDTPTSPGFSNTNYWVTPLWAYHFKGFYKPIYSDSLNQARAGRAIPVKFSLGGNMGLDIFKPGYPKVISINCSDVNAQSSLVYDSESTISSGCSSLKYDPKSKQYIYTWKTSRNWAGQCFQFDLGLNDDTTHVFNVQFR